MLKLGDRGLHDREFGLACGFGRSGIESRGKGGFKLWCSKLPEEDN